MQLYKPKNLNWITRFAYSLSVTKKRAIRTAAAWLFARLFRKECGFDDFRPVKKPLGNDAVAESPVDNHD
jgi:hypothetical protein